MSQFKVINCLEIKETCIKLAQFEIQKGIKQVSFLYTLDISTKDEEKIVDNLKILLTDFKIGTNLVTSLDRHQVTIRYLKIPSKEPIEINQMIDFQITKLIPYPKEATIYSWQILNTDKSGYSNIILAIVHENIVLRHLNLLSKVGLNTQQISFDALAIANWYLWSAKGIEETILLIDIDWLSSSIEVIISGGLFFTRAVKIGTKALQAKENKKSTEDLINEIKLSISAYYKENFDRKINRIILTGATLGLKKLQKFLEKELNFKIEVKPVLTDIEIKEGLAERKEFEPRLFSLTSVLGLGLGLENITINLLPEKIKQIQAKRVMRRKFILSIILSFLIIFSITGFLAKRIHDKSNYLNFITQQVDKVRSEAEILVEKKRNLDLIRDRFSEKGSCLDILLELHKIIPSQIALSSFDFEGESITLKGDSPNMAGVFQLVSILEASSFFSGAEVRYARMETGKDAIIGFEIYSLLAK